ncbi:hypothetical protein [uncultured Thermanaerothrix sp.]|uniref:hypothetical protein n=1 Tax=uncultured Thermanaerothrix sp. TaxID=1195149 RepID=UPI00262DD749|nr:hypothetical protein [uncultured Thermanaerothrix sp.]
MKRRRFLEGYRTKALASVKGTGKWRPIGIAVDARTGWVLTIGQLSGEDAQSVQEWVAPIAESMQARVLVSEDADTFKTVADRPGLFQQVGKSHVVRRTEALIEHLPRPSQPVQVVMPWPASGSPPNTPWPIYNGSANGSIPGCPSNKPSLKAYTCAMPEPPRRALGNQPAWLTAYAICSSTAGACGCV